MTGSAVVIIDKDGGRAVELTPVGNVPVHMAGTGDRAPWSEIINITASGDNTIHTPASGKKFFIETLVISARAACGVQLKSGANANLTGQMTFAANGGLTICHAGEAKLKGLADAQAFIVNTSGDSLTPYVSGWASGYDV